MQKHVNLVDLVKSFPTNIYLQNLASIQKRTSPVKFAHVAEKSGKSSISNLSTKVVADRAHVIRVLRPKRDLGREGVVRHDAVVAADEVRPGGRRRVNRYLRSGIQICN